MTYGEYAAAVTEARESGCSLEEVEGLLIEPAALDDDQKSALWLLAWSYLPSGNQRSFALEPVTITR